MPLDPSIESLLPLVEDLPPMSEALGDPEVAARLQAFERDAEAYSAPDVAARDVDLMVGSHPFRVRVYGRGDGTSPGLVWNHGGAFMAGDLDMNEADMVAREVVERTDAVVISVDYSLVPIARFPVPHQQVMATLLWAIDNAQGLGVDRSRISLGGASAGAALALSASRDLARRGSPGPAALILAYPVAHRSWDVDPVVEAVMADIPPILRIGQDLIEQVNAAYLGEAVDPDLAFIDAMAEAVPGLPPTLVIVNEFDDLRVSGDLLVAQAERGGCRVERYLAAGMLHGHLNRTPVILEVDRTLDHISRAVLESDVAFL